MKPRTKSVLALLVTLIIGVAIGFLSWSTMHNQRLKKIREARNERGSFYSMVESKVAPVDPAVEEEFRSIVESYRTRLHAYYHESVRGREAILDSMITDLDTVLTAEQTMRLRDRFLDDDDDDDDRDRDRGDDRRGDSNRDDNGSRD